MICETYNMIDLCIEKIEWWECSTSELYICQLTIYEIIFLQWAKLGHQESISRLHNQKNGFMLELQIQL